MNILLVKPSLDKVIVKKYKANSWINQKNEALHSLKSSGIYLYLKMAL